MNILIDPRDRTIRETTTPFALRANPVALAVEGLGVVHHNPMSPLQQGIYPFYFEPTGLMLGPVLLTEVIPPLPAIERLVTWVSTLMVVNGATVIIPCNAPPNPM